jgi:penicillin-binding protein 2
MLSKKANLKFHGGWLKLLIFLVVCGLVGYTTYYQFAFGGISSVLAQKNLTAENQILAPRGVFYDRNGVQLVQNEVVYDLYLNKQGWLTLKPEQQSSALQLLTQQLSLTKDELNASIVKIPNHQFGKVHSNIDLTQAVKLEEFITKDKLWQLKPRYIRSYPYGALYSQIIGYTGLDDYGEQTGKYRLEQLLNTYLVGKSGVQVDGVTNKQTAARAGHNVYLTIDHQWQAALYKILSQKVDQVGGQAGAVSIVDIKTGELISYVSYPSFNPNQIERGISNAQHQVLVNDGRKPLVDKVIGIQASTGSTFKIFTAYNLLENSGITSATRIQSTGCMRLGDARFCEFGRRRLGKLDITTALARSSNIFFCQTLGEMQKSIGVNKIVDTYARFGFGQRTGLGFTDELAGVLPTPQYKQQSFKQGWFLGDTCNLSIGQGMFVATPLQMTTATAALFNQGKLWQPVLWNKVLSQEGEVIQTQAAQIKQEIPLSQTTASLINSGMDKVAHMPGGTAYNVLKHVPGNLRVKTGSAEAVDIRGADQVHSWLVATFDYQGKTYAMTGHIYFGGGGWHLNPVLRDFMHCLHSNFPAQCR